tara:strand:- start:70 stop:483 length:414 start_codon:yes stop_codon:yes gene_type:complete
MAAFGKTSQRRLDSCHEEFKIVMNSVINQLPYTCPVSGLEIVDCGIICGYRGEDEQEQAFRHGHSKAKYGESKHNFNPSQACDTLPMAGGKYLWKDKAMQKAYAKLVMDTAWGLGYKWKWGGAFKSFYDGPHMERID